VTEKQLAMLLILIPIAWLAVVTMFVAVCQASASGEAAVAPSEEPGYRIREGLVVWDRDAAIALRYARARATRAPASRRPPRPKRTPRSRRLPAHSAR
jgi:hypothetical protein